MFEVLLRSQPDVRKRLFELVRTSPKPVLVAQEHDLSFGGPFERRMPYRHLLEHKAPVSIVVVADEGHEGLWRDPVGDLAEEYFDDPKDVASALSGYILFLANGRVTYLKRDLWDPGQDVRSLARKLALDIPVPEKAKSEQARPRFRRADDKESKKPKEKSGRFRLSEDDEQTDPEAEPRQKRNAPPQPPPPDPAKLDPFAVLGLPRSAGEAEVKKAFRALVVQYHPDKVAHLAPEFRVLAEQKTRELTAAYEVAQRILRGEPVDG